jgi:hypothetical protein
MRIGIVRTVSALGILAVVVLSTVSVAQGITVNGQVTGRNSEPKQFASVSLDGPGRYVAVTDAQGIFTIPNVTPGRYTVRVRQGDLVGVFTRDIGSERISIVVKW